MDREGHGTACHVVSCVEFGSKDNTVQFSSVQLTECSLGSRSKKCGLALPCQGQYPYQYQDPTLTFTLTKSHFFNLAFLPKSCFLLESCFLPKSCLLLKSCLLNCHQDKKDLLYQSQVKGVGQNGWGSWDSPKVCRTSRKVMMMVVKLERSREVISGHLLTRLDLTWVERIKGLKGPEQFKSVQNDSPSDAKDSGSKIGVIWKRSFPVTFCPGLTCLPCLAFLGLWEGRRGGTKSRGWKDWKD